MSLQDLPPELVERVAALLPLHDVCALRLTERAIASKATPEHFKTCFHTKRLEVTESRLRSFVGLTECNGLVCLLKDLTLIQPVYNTLELEARLKNDSTEEVELDDDGGFVELDYRNMTVDETNRMEQDLDTLRHRRKEQLEFQSESTASKLLGKAFANLAKHGTALHRLQVEVLIYQDDAVTPLVPLYGGSWEQIWSSAARISKLVFLSLATSYLSIKSLNLFNSSRMQRCSLSCNELNEVNYGSDDPPFPLDKLEALSLNLSDRTEAQNKVGQVGSQDNQASHHLEQTEDNESDGVGKEEVSDFAGLRTLLQASSQLKELDLLRYALRHATQESTARHCQGFLDTLNDANLPMLQKLTLQGLDITANQLLNVLQAHKTLRIISLRKVTLSKGKFKPILEYCTSGSSSIDEVELDSLFESDILIFGTSRAPSNTLIRADCTSYPGAYHHWLRDLSIGAADSQIEYRMRRGRTMDTSAIRNWRQDMRNRHGPPQYAKPSCIRNLLRPYETWRV